MKLIVLGPNGTYSHLAASKKFPHATVDFVDSITQGFELLKKHEHDAFIAPVENLIHGTVRETIDGLYENKLKIEGAISLPIKHSLLGKTSKIKKIYSHNQALNQCRNFLEKNYKNVELISCNSTAQACEKAMQENFSAAIANDSILRWYQKLKLIKNKIEDNHKNKTIFFVISQNYSLLNEKFSSIVIEPNLDESGILFEILKIFKKRKINLSKIESRPNRKAIGSYLFYMDFEGDFRAPKIEKVLNKVKNSKVVKKLTVLGSYSI